MSLYLERLPRIGKIFFAIGIIAIGIEHFVFSDFIIGRAPAWPDDVPGRYLWAYGSGFFFVSAGVMIIINVHVRRIALTGVLFIFAWSFLRHLPIIISDSFLAASWTSAGKAMVFIGGLLVMAATSTQQVKSSMLTSNFNNGMIIIGRVCLGIFLLITGSQHFVFIEFVSSLIPGWFPGNPVFWSYFAGVALICGGIGLLIRKTTSLAALLSGTMIFSWFWIVHLPIALTSKSANIAVFEALAFSGIAFVLVKPEILSQK